MGRRPTLGAVATAVALAVVQVGGSVGASNGQPDRRALDALAVVLLLLGPAALAFRERWPHATVLVAIAATGVFIGRGHAFGPVFAAPVVGLYLAGLTPHRRRTLLVGAAAFTAVLVAAAVDPRRTGGFPWMHTVLVATWIATVMAVSETVRSRRERRDDEQRRRVSDERLRIAQELHDVLAHDISLVNVQAGVALHLIDEQPEQARAALANIKVASRDALHELRNALDLLRGDRVAPRSPTPRLDGLAALVDGVRASGLAVTLDVPPELPLLSAAVELAAYRIVQEALTNVTRHARARSATVVVRVDDRVHVEVTDDGAGGVPTPGGGITGMRERAAALGGVLEAGPGPNGGFRVAAALPRTP